MSHKTTLVARRIGFFAAPLCLLLAACGGGAAGGTGVASTPPPPPTPTPTPPPGLPPGTVTYNYPFSDPVDIQRTSLDSPATREGNYDLIGRLTIDPGTGIGGSWTHRNTTPGEFGMATMEYSADGRFTYTLNLPDGLLPGGLTWTTVASPEVTWDINSTVAYRYAPGNYGDTIQYLGQRLAGVDKAPNGTETQLFSYDLTRGRSGFSRTLDDQKRLSTNLLYDIGFSYVAMGEWSWRTVDLSGTAIPGTPSGRLLFVNGDRTPMSGIPLSGTATYDARSLELLSSDGTLGIPFTLTADFGARSIATQIDQDFQNFGGTDGTPALGIHVNGSTPFSDNGSFDIPLSGTVNYSYQNEPVPPPSQSVTGDMSGAVFGPHAEQVGGTFSLHRSGESSLLQDVFVGKQRGP